MPLNAVTDATFAADVEASDIPVLVDFWADWCQPCRAMEPVLEQLATSHEGRLKIVKVDADANPQLVTRYKVMSMPTLLVIKQGQVVQQLVGAKSKTALEGALAEWV